MKSKNVKTKYHSYKVKKTTTHSNTKAVGPKAHLYNKVKNEEYDKLNLSYKNNIKLSIIYMIISLLTLFFSLVLTNGITNIIFLVIVSFFLYSLSHLTLVWGSHSKLREMRKKLDKG
jgi:hypothetical protein